MKRLIAGGLLLLVVAIGIVVVWRQTHGFPSASQIAPVNCLAYVELPDLAQTAKHWPDTSLCRILSESSVQHFIRQPISNGPVNYRNAWASFAALRCSALFLGVTEPDPERWICGLQTSANDSTWHEINNLTKSLFGQKTKEIAVDTLEREGPKAEGSAQISAQIYGVRTDGWILLSRSTELLKEAVRNSKTASSGLQSLKLFQECRANVPIGYDLLSFVQGEPSLDPSSGLHWRFREQETQSKPHAVMAVTTIVGARLRDTVFTLTDKPANSSSFDRKGLALTSPSTIGYLATRLGFSEIWRCCSLLSEESQLAETIQNYMGQVKSFGVEPRDLDDLVSGAEIIVDRDPKADFLKGAVSLQVIDPAKFQRLMDQVVTEKFPDNSRKIEVASVPAYLLQVNERVSIVFGLVGGQLLISGSPTNFGEIVSRLKSQAPGLQADAQFKAVVKLVAQPDDVFAYLDAKSGFERLYDASRPMLVFGILLMPALNRYVDAMALPETGDISKHLSPIVLSRHRVSNGVVDESIGPITAYDAVALLLGGALAMGLWDH